MLARKSIKDFWLGDLQAEHPGTLHIELSSARRIFWKGLFS